MNTNELRIGNLFQERQTKEIITVTELSVNKITFSGSFEKEWQAEPIELNEEILLKMGFKKFSKDFSFGNIIIHTRKVGYVLRKSVPPIKYLHQLQNLMFSLTGKELTIK